MFFFCFIGNVVEKSVTSSKINLNLIWFREDVDKTIVISDVSSPRRHKVLPTLVILSLISAGCSDDSVLIEFTLNIKRIRMSH